MQREEIVELRTRLGLSQTAFAMRLGVTVDMVRKYEQGKNQPSDRIRRVLETIRESLLAVEGSAA